MISDDVYRELIVARYDASTEIERRELFLKALSQMDDIADRHYRLIDAYEELMRHVFSTK